MTLAGSFGPIFNRNHLRSQKELHIRRPGRRRERRILTTGTERRDSLLVSVNNNKIIIYIYFKTDT